MLVLKPQVIAATAICLLIAACSAPVFRNAPLPQRGALQAQNTPSNSLPKPETIQMPSPNHNERPDGMRADTIVLHHTATASTAEAVGRFFARPGVGVSSHYIVDRTGYIVQPVSDELRSWHAGRSQFNGRPDVNSFSIGIEICNLGDSVEPYSDIQYDALIRLVAYLVQHHQIPLENITRHRDIAVPAGRKIDTSNNFSVPRLMKGVQALLAGNYRSPANLQAPAPLEVPAWREIQVKAGQESFMDLADIYLDMPSRWVEIEALNPHLQAQKLQPGQVVRLPNTLDFWHNH